jgi:hypothetical protein
MSLSRTENTISLDGAVGLKARFNASSDGPQLLALVSPTCEVCLDGVATVLKGLDEAVGGSFRAHIVWTPVLSGDNGTAAAAAATDRQGERVEHYWDGTKSLSRAAHTVLDLAALDRAVAWDVSLLYRSGASWSIAFPAPASWLHQLRIEDRPSLDPDSLRSAMRAATS